MALVLAVGVLLAGLAMGAPALAADSDEEADTGEASGDDEGGGDEDEDEDEDEDGEEDAVQDDGDAEPSGDESEAGEGSDASLIVAVSEEGVTVTIDGEVVGETPLAAIGDLSVGTHDIEATKDGFHPYAGSVTVPAEGMVRHDIVLEGGARTRSKVPAWLKSWWFWTVVGVVVGTGVGVGIYFGVRPEEPDAIGMPPF